MLKSWRGHSPGCCQSQQQQAAPNLCCSCLGSGAAPPAWSEQRRACRPHRVHSCFFARGFPPALRRATESRGGLTTTTSTEWDLFAPPRWHSRRKKHVLKLEEKRKLAQAWRETQQELLRFYLFKFNRDISALN